jgi:malate dehydrogenase (oxaloacetate-decarboxylating)(NADP+)
MSAACELFGKGCLLQFEDFNSNDAFPLLAEYREKFLCYNDDIQGTASVAVAAILGGIKIQKPKCTDLIGEARSMRFLFHGSGSANLGCANLLRNEAGVAATSVFCTNSRGLIWKSADGTDGSFRNDEQKEVAQTGKPPCGTDLISIINYVKPDVLIGAVGRDPGCFTKEVIDAMMSVQSAKPDGGSRPVVFALSNPKTQSEITAKSC